VLCGGKCVDPSSDRTFCGAQGDCAGPNDGTTCSSGEVCTGGTCQASCLAGQVLCGGKCVDPSSDRTFCGAQGDCAGANDGTTCGSGEVCTGGSCQASCLAGQVLCGGKCVDPSSDRTFCGAQADCAGPNDGVACSAQEVCSAGACLNNDATLSGLAVSHGALSPAFAPGTFLYVVNVTEFIASVRLTPTATAGATGTTLTVNGTPVLSGSPSAPIALGTGSATSITLRVVAASGAERIYGVVVVRGSPDSAYLKASNTDASDSFGMNGVAISGDTLVVGAPYEASSASGVNPALAADGTTAAQSDNSAPRAGAVYVFTRVNGAWTQQAYLKASNADANDEFGHTVAVHGDTLVVGAPEETGASPGVNGDQASNLLSGAGAVYVFTRSNGTWTQQAYLKASHPRDGAYFGSSLSIEGDTLAVGAAGDASSARGVNPVLTPGGADAQSDVTAPGSGAVYVFTRAQGAWSQQAYVKASNTGAGDMFGSSVSLSGSTLAVGAFQEASGAAGVNGDPSDNSCYGCGAVYVFTQAQGTWSQQAYLKASNPGPGDGFGQSVSLSGETLAVGAPSESSSARGVNPTQTPGGADAQSDDSASLSGAVYVFTRLSGTWTQQAYLKSSSNTVGTQQAFGWSVALSDDTLVVGAPYEASNATSLNGNPFDTSAQRSGAVFVLARTGGTWAERTYVKASNTGAQDLFGYCVAFSGQTLAVAGPGEDSSATGMNGVQGDNSRSESGAVYVWAPKLN
jgi:hypothetical protein